MRKQRVTDRPTVRRTDGHTLLQRCGGVSKNDFSISMPPERKKHIFDRVFDRFYFAFSNVLSVKASLGHAWTPQKTKEILGPGEGERGGKGK